MARTEWGYGFFCGGDPRKFHPDEESSTEAERASHKAACEAWEAGDTTALPGSCVHFPGGHITLSGFGLGSYEYDVDDPWDPCVMHCESRRVPRRLKKRLQRAGYAPSTYGWVYSPWFFDAAPKGSGDV